MRRLARLLPPLLLRGGGGGGGVTGESTATAAGAQASGVAVRSGTLWASGCACRVAAGPPGPLPPPPSFGCMRSLAGAATSARDAAISGYDVARDKPEGDRGGDWRSRRPRARGPPRGDELLRGIQSAPSLLDLEDLLEANVRSLTYVHLGAASLRAARLADQARQATGPGSAGGSGTGGSGDAGAAAAVGGPRTARQLQRLMRQLEGLHERAMPLLPARPIAHLLYAAAKAGHQPSERLLLAAAQQLTRNGGARIGAAAGADLAQLSWGMARMGAWLPELQQAIDEAVVSRARDLDIRAVTMLLTAAHLVNNTDSALLNALALRALELAPSAAPEQLARAVHALVKLAHPSETVLQGIAVALEPQLACLDNASLLLLLDSYRIAAHPSGRGLAVAALPLVQQRVGVLSAGQLSKAARVFAQLVPQPFLTGSSGTDGSAGSSGGSTSCQDQAGASVSSTQSSEGGGRGGGGGGGSSSGAAGGSGGFSRPASVDDLMASISQTASARLVEFNISELRVLLRHLKGHATPELRAAAEAGASAVPPRPRESPGG